MENRWREITSWLIPAAPDASPSSLFQTRPVEVEENLGQELRAGRELSSQMKVLLHHLVGDMQLWVRGRDSRAAAQLTQNTSQLRHGPSKHFSTGGS